MSDSNVKFIQATKEILKDMGIEIKTSQLYEMYSKLLGEKNWNIAKSKSLDLSKVIYENNLMVDLVKNIDLLDPSKVVQEFHRRLGHKILSSGQADKIILAPNFVVNWAGRKVCVVFMKNDNENKLIISGKEFKTEIRFNAFNHKHIDALRKHMNEMQVYQGLIICDSPMIPKALLIMAKEGRIELIDKEDFIRLATLLDQNGNIH